MFTNPSGDYGELRVARQLKRLDTNEYKLLNDITIKYKTYTTQIDHILLSTFGIFVIETKALTGKIITSKDKWLQCKNGKKVEIINPYKQNDYHIDILEKISGISKNKFVSLVVFTEDEVELDDTYNFGILNLNTLNPHILKANLPIISSQELVFLVRKISTHLCSIDEHLKNVQK